MVDNLIKGVLLGIFGYVWYWVAVYAPWLNDGGTGAVADGYMFFTIVAAALLASGK